MALININIDLDTASAKDVEFFSLISAALHGAQPQVASNSGNISTASSTSALSAGAGVDASPPAAVSTSPSDEGVGQEGEAAVKKRGRKPKDQAAPATVVESTSQATAEAGAAPSLDDVRTALQAFTQANTLQAGIDLLGTFSAGRISELKPEQYVDFIVKCKVTA